MSLYKVHSLFTLIIKQYIFEGKHKKLPKLIFSALKHFIKTRISFIKYILLNNCNFLEFERHCQITCDLL